MFIRENIKNWILQECAESGRPEDFFDVVVDVVGEIQEESSVDPEQYWQGVVDEIFPK